MNGLLEKIADLELAHKRSRAANTLDDLLATCALLLDEIGKEVSALPYSFSKKEGD